MRYVLHEIHATSGTWPSFHCFFPRTFCMPLVSFAEKGRKTMAASWKMWNVLSSLSTVLCQNMAKHKQDTPAVLLLLSNRHCFLSQYVGGPAKYRRGTGVGLNPCRLHLSDHCRSKLVAATKQPNERIHSFSSDWLLLHSGVGCTLLPAPGSPGPVPVTASFSSPLATPLCFFYPFHGYGLQTRPGERTQVFHTWGEIIPDALMGLFPLLQLLLWTLLSDYFLSSSCLLCSSYASRFTSMGKV